MGNERCQIVVAALPSTARNIPYVEATLANTLNTYDVLKYDHIVFTQAAFELVEQRLGAKEGDAE